RAKVTGSGRRAGADPSGVSRNRRYTSRPASAALLGRRLHSGTTARRQRVSNPRGSFADKQRRDIQPHVEATGPRAMGTAFRRPTYFLSPMVIGIQTGFSRTVGAYGTLFQCNRLGRHSYPACRTRARSSSKPARPYICRFIVFSRFTCPSTGPLL